MKRDLQARFNEWLRSPTGKTLQRIEYNTLKKLKPNQPAERVLMIGGSAQNLLFKAYKTNQRILVTHQIPKHSSTTDKTIVAHFDELPLLPNSVDFVLLPHTLDFSKHVNYVLREVNISLQPEGYIVIIGFNPYSLWGLRRLFSMRWQAPWCANFYPLWRVKGWLTLLNYEIVTTKKFLYRPHAKRFGLFRKFAFLESFVRVLFPFAGSVYIVIAKKKVFGMTPLRLQWGKLPKVFNKGVVPTSRAMRERDND